MFWKNTSIALISHFLGEKYHIQLIDKPVPVVYTLYTVRVHILPLYKAELENMSADDIIAEATQPIDWVNFIVWNIKKLLMASRKIDLA